MLIAQWSLLNNHCSLLNNHSSLLNNHSSLLIAHCSIIIAHYLIILAHYLIILAHYLMIIAHNDHCSLLNDHCSLLKIIDHCSIIIAHCSLLICLTGGWASQQQRPLPIADYLWSRKKQKVESSCMRNEKWKHLWQDFMFYDGVISHYFEKNFRIQNSEWHCKIRLFVLFLHTFLHFLIFIILFCIWRQKMWNLSMNFYWITMYWNMGEG